MCRRCQGLVDAIDRYIAKADDELADSLEIEGYEIPKKTLKYAKSIEDEVAGILLDETDLFVAKMSESIDLEDYIEKVWPGVALTDQTAAKVCEVFIEELQEFMPEAVSAYISKTDKALKLERVSNRTVSWIESWSTELGNLMQLNSQTQIENILKKGLANGESTVTVVRNILTSGIRDEYYKARRVAVTEMLRAHSVAQQEAYMQSPVVVQKRWRHTGSYKNQPRQNHVDMDGQTVDKSEPYILIGIKGGTYYPMYPRDTNLPPEESINCHCLSQSVTDPKIVGLTAEEKAELQAEALAEMDDEWEKELDAYYERMQRGNDNED